MTRAVRMRTVARRVAAAAAGALALAGLASLSGAEAPGPAPAGEAGDWTTWAPPARAPIRLVDLEPRIVGGSEQSARPIDLFSLEGESLAEHCRIGAGEDDYVVTCLELPQAASGAEILELFLRPGGADRIVVRPLAVTTPTDAVGVVTDAQLRSLDVPLDATATSTGTLRVGVPLGEALRGNWSSAAEETRLVGLEISLPGAPGAAIDLLRLVAPGDVLGGRRARSASIEAAGAIRPAWIVRSGAALRFQVTVPSSDPVLRWYAARRGPAGPLVVRVPGWFSTLELDRVDAGSGWRRREVSLDRWAGKRITLELVAESADSRDDSGLALFGDPEVTSERPASGTPSVLVYLVDTLRADRLGAYGHAAARTPVIDRLAREGWTYRGAIAPSSWTKPVIVSLMTGHDPLVHRIGSRSFTDRLRDDVPLLQETFRTAGFRTGSFVANPLAGPLSGLGRGFSPAVLPRRWQGETGAFGHPSAAMLHGEFLGWLDDAPDAPFFAWIHTLEVHEYAKPPFAASDGDWSAAYDAAVAAADTELGSLLEAIERRGRLDDLVVIFVSDHGESIFEHGIRGHGLSLYQPEIHVPLVIWSPAIGEPASIPGYTTLLELPGALLELAGLEADGPFSGSRLVGAARGEATPPRPAFSSVEEFPLLPGAPMRFAVLDADGRKLIRLEPGGDLRFNLEHDPDELDSAQPIEERLDVLIDRWRAESERAADRLGAMELHVGPAPAPAPDDLERLRSLGYVE